MDANYLILGIFLAAFLMSLVLHEVAHGWVARACGDHTAEMAGRLSLNPLRHIDPMMTIIMPLVMLYMTKGRFMFGAAKPVPVNPYNLRNFETDDLKVSLAGVTVNFVIAGVCGLLLHLFAVDTIGFTLFTLITVVNLLLGFFNLIPIPPLDGSHVMRFILSRIDRRMAESYERLGRLGMLLVLVFVVFFGHWLIFAIDFVWLKIFALESVYWGAVIRDFRASFG